MSLVRKVNPGDLRHVSVTLRNLMSAYDTAAHVVNASFAEFSPELDGLAADVRVAAIGTADKIHRFLQHLEETPAFIQARAEHLKDKS